MKYLIIFLLLLPGLESIAQKNKNSLQENIRGTILEINPNDDGFTKTRLPFGSTVKFKITNVNPFKIEGTNSISKESISFDVPVQLSQTLTHESVGNLQPVIKDENKKGSGEELAHLVKNLNQYNAQLFQQFPSDLISHISKSDAVKIKALKKQIIKLEKDIEILKKIQQLRDSIDNFKTQFIKNYNGFVSTLFKLSLYTSADIYIDSLLQETFIIDTTTLKSNLKGYMTSINDNNTDINLLRGKCITTLDSFNKYYINAKGAYDDLAKKIKNEKLILDDWESKNKEAKIKIESLSITLIREKIFEKEFQFLTAKYDTINSNNNRTSIVNKTNAGIDYYNRVQNAKFEVYTDAQQLNDDIITITPKLKNAKGDILKEYSPMEIKTYGGWKVDVSTGYFLSFRGDENYTYLYKGDGISGVQKNKTDNLKHSIGALFNFYRRTGNDVNFGPSLGVSIPTDGSSIGFYAGVSALILEKNRLVISIGIAQNRIKMLNTGNLLRDKYAGNLSGKETYTFSNTEFREIKYDNVYRPAIFIGISYNIFTIKKAE